MPALGTTTPVTGAPCWVSLVTPDPRAARSFYAQVMGWEFLDSSLGTDFSVAVADGEPVAGMGYCHGRGLPARWTPYFAVADADETADRIRERGATLAVGPARLGGGRAALAADRDGAAFGFWEGPALAWTVGRGSAPARLDLMTRHAFEAAIFYAEVFDWAKPGSGGCTVDYAQDHVVIQVAGHTVATLRGGGMESAPDPRMRPRWVVDFRVADSRAAAAAADAADGESTPALPPLGCSKDAYIIRDPGGALFTVSGPGAE
ncbi:VOC family protein [Streptomyces sp. NPDC001743]|uniref:VOC family protein n=1 Tax=Streptomyces sp. NPDC001743 TaxID=3154397 RepID=UPI00331FE91E